MSTPFLSDDLDPRLTPARDDLAASWLKERIKASRYADPVRKQIAVPVASMYINPEHGLSVENQLLHGELVDVYDSKDGWSWIQSAGDSYVGYVVSSDLSEIENNDTVTHRVSNISTLIYPAGHTEATLKTALGAFVQPGTSYKTTPTMSLSYGSHVHVVNEKEVMSELSNGCFVPTAHLAPLDFHSEEPLAEAFRFLGVPYLWGGRSNLGVDCSSLVQLVLQACNIKCPRDCDLQERLLGKAVDRDQVRAGDLAFFRGHVGIMVDDSTILHASDRNLAVSIDDLDEYLRWRGKVGKSPLKMFKRL